MSDHDNDAASKLLIQEIQEDLKREQYAKLWKAYGNWTLAAAVAVIVLVAGQQGWQSWRQQLREAEAQRYAAASLSGNADETLAALGRLSGEAKTGYKELAELRRAALLAEKGDADAAVAAYDKLAADSGIDRIYRELAAVRSVILQLDKADPAALDARLQTLGAGPWRHTAMEMQAVLAQRQSNGQRAVDIYKRLADDVTAPNGLRARAAEMLAILTPNVQNG